ncbi:GmrSD restriction endonuclease domain-containing protein [Microbacterium soli]|uniref:Excalibur calcium-binding domain-containing protein n=1 Tax=Microbacterium soli TaxID=446075 RepID=A0ABP7MPX1_9MICO
MSTPMAGWYPDPTDPGRVRWWDGAAWTAQVRQMHQPSSQALSLLPPPAQGSGQSASAGGKKKLPVWAWIVIGVAALLIGVLLSPIFTVLWLVVLITGIVALVKNTPTWLRFGNRRAATIVTAVSAVCFLLTGSIANAVIGNSSRASLSAPITSSAPEPTDSMAAASAEPSRTPSPEADDAGDDVPVAFVGDASTVGDASRTQGLTALQVLESLPVKGRAAKTGYDRAQFGQRWLDVDHNGCDTRNDILARDLSGIERAGACRVLSGVLADPYTGQSISFVRGQGTSEFVQIDHVVALSDAWQKGAQQLSADQRATFANDPMNLLAVDGSANAQKNDGDAATWLPKNKDFRCAYVARQIAVKATYGLWVTQAEHDAIARVLSACPDEPVLTSAFAKVAPEPVPVETVPAPTPAHATSAPAPVMQAPSKDVYYANCTAVRAAGAAPLHAGDPGYARKLDRDGDGIACE